MPRKADTRDRSTSPRDSDLRAFLTEAVRDLRTTGAIAPSSRHLAAKLAEPLRNRTDQSLRVLEVGAGTGAVTTALIALLGATSHLDVVEANPRFAERLYHPITEHPRNAGIHVHAVDLQHLETDGRYDSIVSGLPFTNMQPAQVQQILTCFLELLRPGGALTYFAYLGTGPGRRLFASRAEGTRHHAVQEILAAYQHQYATGSSTVWRNVPPARVWELQAPVPADATHDAGPPTTAGQRLAVSRICATMQPVTTPVPRHGPCEVTEQPVTRASLRPPTPKVEAVPSDRRSRSGGKQHDSNYE